jgi:putative phage-type endonuclease
VSILDIPGQRVAELVTPTGVLISTAEPQTDEWFMVRREGITATDVPKILGLSKYGDARSVWHDKRGELPPDEAGEAAHWGNLLEDIVATEWAAQHDTAVTRVGVIHQLNLPWMRAALDRLVDSCPDGGTGCGLEVKTRSAYVAGRWREDMPDDVLAQVAWQRMVSGVDHIHVAALIGGQRMVEHRYDPDLELEEYLLAQATTLWEQVQSGEVPIVEPSQILAEMLDRLFPDRSGEAEIPESLAEALADAYEQAKALEREAEAAKVAARAAVLDALGPAESLVSEGDTFFTYKPQTKRSVKLPALKKSHPDLYAALTEADVITETTSRVLRFTHKETS